MADDKQVEKAEDLTPTPTQAEMDETMAKLSGTEVVKKREAKADTDLDPMSTPPTMTQAENDEAHKAARPGDVPPEGSTDPQKQKKQLEADKSEAYQTRVAAPAKPK